MDMIAARFHTNAQAGRAYNGLIHLGCGSLGELRSVSVTGYSSYGWMEENIIAGSDLQTWSSLRRQPRGGQRVQQMKAKRARINDEQGGSAAS